MTGWLLLIFYTIASSLGLLLIKSGLSGNAPFSAASLLSARLVAGAVLYAASFAAWIGVLAALPLSVAYPVAIGLTLTCSTFGAALFLHERLDATKLLGIACVFAAVLLFTAGGRRG